MKLIGYVFWDTVRVVIAALYDAMKFQHMNKFQRTLLNIIRYSYEHSNPEKYQIEVKDNYWKGSKKPKKY